ncbi:hypothetical protein ACE6H2_023530 [Prunus campanulata]
MCNSKIIGVRYFDETCKNHFGKFAGTNSARDTIGHGTITSSIAAGNYVEEVSYFGLAKGTIKGVAPLAKLTIYKVAWEEGILGSDALIGMDQAIADAIKSAMMTTADELDNTKKPIREYLGDPQSGASPLAIGAGHINANRAIDPGLIYDASPQDYVNYLCALDDPNPMKLVKSFFFSFLIEGKDIPLT